MSHLTDPSEIAIVTYALSIANIVQQKMWLFINFTAWNEGGKFELFLKSKSVPIQWFI